MQVCLVVTLCVINILSNKINTWLLKKGCMRQAKNMRHVRFFPAQLCLAPMWLGI
jgi:hypothetical protein